MMPIAEKRILYKAFGLAVTSEIPLPELPYVGDEADSIDVEIKMADLSRQWVELSKAGDSFVIKENLIMFRAPNVATFSILEGNTITVSPEKSADEDQIRLYLLGTCMGALLMQRAILPLHGSVVAIDGKAYAFVGERGAGKSTLAAAFLNKGYRLLSDDVIAVSLDKENVPQVTPSYPQQKLWQDCLHNLGMKISDYRSIHGRETKYNVPVSSNYYTEPLPLAGVFELIKTEGRVPMLYRVEKLERFDTLFRQTFRHFLIQRSGLMDWHFQTSAQIVNKIGIYQLRRPASGFNVDKLATIILNNIKGETGDDSK